ncbi:hypothetical protein AQUCO_00800170v1 [Aquilegia coerulea]|uniref:DOG1 domain-containing protein n=1 Tax=Aquilegia coerulea TaxID=218851 RepID=A0A2G5EI39_AQUCA|nr:hypothetical protein AQUCO_00800170v1 [Aquilegia coerulea]
MKRYSVDERTAELMGMVEAGVSKLNTEIKQEESLLIQLIDHVCDSYARDTKEYGYAVASEDQRKMLTEELQRHVTMSMNCLSNNANQKMYMVFRKLIELIEPRIIQSSV